MQPDIVNQRLTERQESLEARIAETTEHLIHIAGKWLLERVWDLGK